MKVIKRDGRAVEFDRSKIEIAIEKANKEVREKERATKEEIKSIINYVTEQDRKRILVEDIQDIIEEQLMDLKRFELAKKYMIYRYTRALVRKANSTDQSILGLIKNQNRDFGGGSKNTIIASVQRDLIAGEVSKDLTKRILLPEKISKAHEDGVLFFHDADYFLQPIFNSCIIDLQDMLDNGTTMNGTLIESPKSFQVACTVTTQIIANVASAQYGGQTVNVSHLGKYLRKSHEKIKKEMSEFKDDIPKKVIDKIVEKRLNIELSSGVQTMGYQINTLMTTNGKPPFVTLFLYLEKDDEYKKENAMIIEEILKQRIRGVKDKNGDNVSSSFPKLVYVLDEDNCLNGGEFDYLTRLALECASIRTYPDFISAKVMRKQYSGNVFAPMGCRSLLSPWKEKSGAYKFEGRFNQGVVTINLPQIALSVDGNEEKFWVELEERLKVCFEALMCRHYALLGTTSDVSPIHYRFGAIARLESGEKIDDLLKDGYSTISLGYIGIYETTKIIKGVSHTEQEGHDFAITLLKKLKTTVEAWKKETGLGFVLYGTPSKLICKEFAKIDLENFGKIKDVTDKGYYTSSYNIDLREEYDVFKQVKFEQEFQALTNGGAITYLNISSIKDDEEKKEELIKEIYDELLYSELCSSAEDCEEER